MAQTNISDLVVDASSVYWNNSGNTEKRPNIRGLSSGVVGRTDRMRTVPNNGGYFEFSVKPRAVGFIFIVLPTVPTSSSPLGAVSTVSLYTKWVSDTATMQVARSSTNIELTQPLTAGYYYIGVRYGGGSGEAPPPVFPVDDASSRAGLGSETNPIVFPTVASPSPPSVLTASHGTSGITLNWRKAAARHSSFDIFYKTSTGVTDSDNAIRMSESDANCQSPFAGGATTHDRDCTATIAYADLTDIDSSNHGYFALSARVNGNASGLSAEATTANTPPSVGDSSTLTLTTGQTGRISMHNISDIDGDDLTFSITSQPDSAIATASIDTATGVVTVVAVGMGRTSVTISATDRNSEPVTQTFTIQVNPPSAPPTNGGGGDSAGSGATAGGGGSGGAVAAVVIAAGAYFWWKKRQIANGNAAKMALLPDVNFDLDRNDNRAFYTKMNWQNSGNSNWQLRGNAKIHTKYSGKLLDWHADSHLGYRLNGKLGEFNPYLRGKFVQNAPENAEMDETYTLGVNYSVPNRFSAQFLQPDDEIWQYSLKTEMQLPKGISLRFNQPNSDIWRYSANLNWQISERIGLSLTQPNNDLPNYGFGIQWRNKSKIRYGISGETGRDTYRFTGQFSF